MAPKLRARISKAMSEIAETLTLRYSDGISKRRRRSSRNSSKNLKVSGRTVLRSGAKSLITSGKQGIRRIEIGEATQLNPIDSFQAQDFPSFPNIDDQEYPEPLTPESPRFPQELNCLMPSAPPSHIVSPSSAEINGEYNFCLALETQPKKVANPDWIYSNIQNKLYIKPQTPCPMKFSLTGSPPPRTYIRAMPIFKLPEHAKDIVRCCPNHTLMDQITRDNPASGHFIRSDNPQAEYQQCVHSGRQSVRIPFKVNVGVAGNEEVTVHELFSFVCNNSCGGLNRRAIQVAFTLETGESNEMLGRCSIEVRVCACPGRDSKQDNEAVSRPSRKKRKLTADVSSSTPLPAFPPIDLTPTPSRSAEDNTVYNLKVCGYVNYLILRKIAFALEFFANMKSRFSTLPCEDPEFTEFFGDGSAEPRECNGCDTNTPLPRPIPQSSPVMNGQQSLPSCAASHAPDNWYQSPQQEPSVNGRSTATPYMGCYTYRRITLSVEYSETESMCASENKDLMERKDLGVRIQG
ncbi:cellular tumor antigen p53-like isoform X2 [Actinia tenebrosa]|uniref:Cellular tumor antigen p53-like isoform X2 n=1 Tax=Actinia tenebrosa TaxID=6105 RepID=A0A6P8IN01_ACTTE|nr:cellular tumor antigen p53-like isoform X2 [Actinia tenebrosa]